MVNQRVLVNGSCEPDLTQLLGGTPFKLKRRPTSKSDLLMATCNYIIYLNYIHELRLGSAANSPTIDPPTLKIDSKLTQ